MQGLKEFIQHHIQAALKLSPGPYLYTQCEYPHCHDNLLNEIFTEFKAQEKFYFLSRDRDLEVVGIEAMRADTDLDSEFLTLPREKHPMLQAFGGLGSLNPEDSESDFSGPRFFIPFIEFIRQNNDSKLQIQIFFEGSDPQALWEKISTASESASNIPDFQETTLDSEELAHWHSMIEKALTEIHHERLSKVVLARKKKLTPVQMDRVWQETLLKKFLEHPTQNTYKIVYQRRPGAVFLCATPERLFQRKDRTLYTEAVAGTWNVDPSSKDFAETHKKETHEQDIVCIEMEKILEDLCGGVLHCTSKEIFPTQGLYHLRTSYQGTLMHGPSTQTILKTLHPTPAIGGHPREIAQDFIQGHEDFHRGWYASPIGIESQLCSDWAIGIRSARLFPQSVEIYAGAGIVEGSDWKSEWEETENKMRPMLSLFLGGQP